MNIPLIQQRAVLTLQVPFCSSKLIRPLILLVQPLTLLVQPTGQPNPPFAPFIASFLLID
jgi:hypothetical protein